MSNIKVDVTMPDPFDRLIANGYEMMGEEEPTKEERVAAFQEIINVLAIMTSRRFHPDMDDPAYFRDMEENVHCWGDMRMRSPQAEAIGKRFLMLLGELAIHPGFQPLIDEKSRRGDDPVNCDPGGGMRSPDDRDDDDRH
jgi:hypothetical protein